MKEELKPIFKNYLDILRLKHELNSKQTNLNSITGNLINGEIKDTCGTYEEDINGLYDWLENNWNVKKGLSLEDKCKYFVQVWSDLRCSEVVKTFPNLESYIESLYQEKSKLKYQLSDFIKEDEVSKMQNILLDAFKMNNNHAFIDYYETPELIEEEENKAFIDASNKLAKKVAGFLTAMLLANMAPRTLADYYFVFDKTPNIKNIEELKESGVKYVKLSRNLIDNYNHFGLIEYNVNIPGELEEFIKEVNQKEHDKINWGLKPKGDESKLDLFLAIYLNVCDKEGTFFKPENYDVEEIKENYKSLTD